jgi:L-seryl-tRNA(Ser) seleniumtransferase
MAARTALLQQLPAIDRLLNAPTLLAMAEEIPRSLLLEAAQETVAALRRELLELSAAAPAPELSVEAVAQRAAQLASEKMRPSLRQVINATGTLLHTNLGRAPLAQCALEAIAEVSRGYSNLEFDLQSGERGHRFSHVEDLLCRLTGAEAAVVVNNNAGAVLLALTALAKGRQAIVSRGEMVEIGGAFRVPEVMAAGGVSLKEVGTTNKTHLRDYREAIGPDTGLLMKIHTSNYRIVGFTSAVSGAELVALGQEQGLPVLEDLGSGMLFDLSPFGLPQEPTVAEAVAAGIDVITFSGDKLLGGPQAGLMVGKKAAIGKIRQHPIARALRIDKLSLAALEATLRLYLDRERALAEIPVLQMLAAPAEAIKQRCRRLARKLRPILGEQVRIEIIPEPAAVGGGALPMTQLPGYALALTPQDISVDSLATRLRLGSPAVAGRIQEGRLLLNPRTIFAAEEPQLLAALRAALGNAGRLSQ